MAIPAATSGRTIADLRGRATPAGERSRIVSLVPSLTETLFALGLGDRVVGVTQYCIEPAEATARLPHLGGTKTPDIAALLALRPEIVMANAEENRAEDIAAIEAAGVPVFVTMPRTVAGAADAMRDIAAVLDRAAEAAPFLADIDAMLAEAQARSEPRPRVFCAIWRRPWMTANGDTYVGDVVRAAGGDNVFAGHADRYPTLSADDIVAADPQIILLPDEPYPFGERHREELARLPIAAARDGRIKLCDGKDITWHWSRTAGAVRRVRALLHDAP